MWTSARCGMHRTWPEEDSPCLGRGLGCTAALSCQKDGRVRVKKATRVRRKIRTRKTGLEWDNVTRDAIEAGGDIRQPCGVPASTALHFATTFPLCDQTSKICRKETMHNDILLDAPWARQHYPCSSPAGSAALTWDTGAANQQPNHGTPVVVCRSRQPVMHERCEAWVTARAAALLT
nr:hypothetical protein CFP56_04038 [Quercus suber]